MRNIKKLLSIAMVLAMVLSLGVSVLASGVTTTTEPKKVDITINEAVAGTTGAKYIAFRLLDLTTTAASVPVEGPDGQMHDGGYAYTVNPKYKEALEAYLRVTDAHDPQYGSTVVKALMQKLTTAAEVDKFASAMYAAIKDLDVDATSEVVDGKNVLRQVPEGYYLIFESEIGVVGEGDGGQNGVRSKIIVDTAGRTDVELKTKEDIPSVEKKVNGADNAVAEGPNGEQPGDPVTFTLTATLPEDYADYETYYLAFHDEMDKGLTLNEGSFTFKVLGDETNYYVAANLTVTSDAEGTKFTYAVSDLKTAIPDLTKDSKLVLTYTATINDEAVVRNYNDVSLEYSNRGGEDGQGTGHTPKDTVVVFTFSMSGNKVDGQNKDLAGASFTLYRSDTEEGTYELYRNEVPTVENETTGKYEFGFKGLKEGFYRLEETVVPNGYNKASDLYFKVEVFDDDNDGNVDRAEVKIKDGENWVDEDSFVFDVDEPVTGEGKLEGNFDTKVINQSGLELPETGGIGTTIFYVVGAILVVGAVILLVSRKRAGSAQK